MTFHSQDINEIKVAKIQGGHMPHEQPCSANDSVSDSSNIPLQGAVEVLSFIKECIFSPDWHSTIYKESCHQLLWNA